MAKSEIVCANPACAKPFMKENGAIKVARDKGANLYCCHLCARAVRKLYRAEEERRRLKAEYDRTYRAANLQKRKAYAAERHKRTYDPQKARLERSKNMTRHIEYCRSSKNREYKKRYDNARVGEKEYADYAEAYKLLLQLERAIRKLFPSKYERLKARGYYSYERVQERKRNVKARKTNEQHSFR